MQSELHGSRVRASSAGVTDAAVAQWVEQCVSALPCRADLFVSRAAYGCYELAAIQQIGANPEVIMARRTQFDEECFQRTHEQTA